MTKYSYAAQLIRKYKRNGLIIDTNLLILIIVGSFDPKIIPRFKRTSKYLEDDFSLMINFIKFFDNIITTPNILTETCNLSLNLNFETENGLYRTFAKIIYSLRENYVTSIDLPKENAFFQFGISDSAIIELCKQGRLLLTDDFPLYGYVTAQGMDAINFNHIRTLNW